MLVYTRTTAANQAQNQGVISNGGVVSVALNASDTPLLVVAAPSQSANLLTVQNSSSTSLFTVSGAGNVGIGAAVPVNKLDVAGDITIASNNALMGNLYYNGGWKFRDATGFGGALKFSTADPSVQFITATGNTGVGSAASINIPFIINSSGNVGIGNTNDSYKLDVTGQINASTGYRYGGTAGSTATCTSNNVFINQVVQGGIVTGGSCSAVGSGTVSTTGTPVANQVAYFNAASVIQGSANYTWNDSTGRLSVTKNQTTNTGITITNGNAGSSAYAELVLATDAGSGGVWMNSIAQTGYGGAGSVNFGASGANRGASIVTNNSSRLVVDASGTVNIGSSALTDSGLNVTSNGASTWTNGGWNKTLKVGVDGSHATIRFPYNSSTQFGLGVTTDGVFRLIRSDNTNNAGSSNYDLTVDTSGNASFTNSVGIGNQLTVNYAEAGYDCNTGSSFCASNWFRSSNATGWYNGTYNVGIYAVQSGWVDTYASANMRINNSAIGDVSGCGGYATFMYYGLTGNCSNYALIQNSSGTTFVNATSGQTLYLRTGNSDRLTVGSGGVYRANAAGCGTIAGFETADFGYNSSTGLCWAGGNQFRLIGNGAPTMGIGQTFVSIGCPAGSCDYGGGTARASVDLSVYGSNGGTCVIGNGTSATSCSSDSRLKHNINYISAMDDLAKIELMQPASYQWNLGNQSLHRGFIAQDVISIFPEVISQDEQGYYMLDYAALTSPLIGAVKQLKVIADGLAGRLAVLEAGNFAGNLQVDGSAEFYGNLTVQGTTTLKDLIVVGNTIVKQLTVDRIISHGDTPTGVLGATTGYNGTVAIEGNDTAGSITYTAGSQVLPAHPLAAGEQITLTFVQPYTTTPRVLLTPTSDKAANIRYYVQRTDTEFKLIFTDVPVAGDTYSFDYQVIQ
jgi:hypothetical protein